MTQLEGIIRAEIRRGGPMRFDRFMALALYHPEFGYYCNAQDPFGISGDFYTAAQMQPEFGTLVRTFIQILLPDAAPAHIRVADLGAGRGEMREALSCFDYVAVERNTPAPERVQIVFANEFFDALEVRAGEWRDGAPHELLVAESAEGFHWVSGAPMEQQAAEYVARYWSPRNEGDRFEIGERALAWIDRAAAMISDGWLIAIDYGHTRNETVRFPQGTLMSYRRHVASEKVLHSPGERDITVHVSFDALAERARLAGFEQVTVGTLGSLLMQTLEHSNAMEHAGIAQRQRLKTLLFGMGETFRVLLAWKSERK